jgi:hypothetical protein
MILIKFHSFRETVAQSKITYVLSWENNGIDVRAKTQIFSFHKNDLTDTYYILITYRCIEPK